MKFKAIGNKVIIKLIKESIGETTSESGLVIVGKKDNGLDVNTVEGLVVSVGEGAINPKTGEYIPIPLEEGDSIVINGNVGALLDKEHRVINVDDIFAKIM